MTMREALDYLATVLAWLWGAELLALGLVCLVCACTKDKQPPPNQTERTPAPVIPLENHRNAKREKVR